MPFVAEICNTAEAVSMPPLCTSWQSCNASYDAANFHNAQDPGCYCPQLISWGFNWLIKDTDLDAKRMSCSAYCAKHPCPGRSGRANCKAKQGSICSEVIRK